MRTNWPAERHAWEEGRETQAAVDDFIHSLHERLCRFNAFAS